MAVPSLLLGVVSLLHNVSVDLFKMIVVNKRDHDTLKSINIPIDLVDLLQQTREARGPEADPHVRIH